MVQVGRMVGEARALPRVTPASSLSAHIFDGDLTVSRGTVSNLSESGAFLVTDRGLARGATVRVVLGEGRTGFLDTQARIVWSVDGVDPHSEIVGSLQGVLFSGLSPSHRERLRRQLSLADALHSGFLENYPPEEDELAYILIDPDIEYLISDDTSAGETLDYKDGIAEIKRELEPYLEQYVSRIYEERSWTDDAMKDILNYLGHQIPDYPFDRSLDCEFITELMADFPGLDVLEEVKTFRWHSHSEPFSQMGNQRAELRRWIAGSVQGRGR
ncbi:MAG: PilZ domain-containing protein [Vicinamibacteria bacterium]